MANFNFTMGFLLGMMFIMLIGISKMPYLEGIFYGMLLLICIMACELAIEKHWPHNNTK